MSAGTQRRSLFFSSGARLGADAGTYLASFGGGVIIARYLGPAGKGVFSSLIFISGLLAQAGGLGIGESAIIAANDPGSSLRSAWHRALPVVLITSLAASFLFIGFAIVAVGHGRIVLEATALAAAGIPPVIVVSTANQLMAAADRTVEASSITAASTGLATGLLAVLLITVGLGLAGAVLASTVGALISLVVTLYALRRYGIPSGFQWSPAFLRRALKFGGVLQLGYLVTSLGGRFDLLLVYWLSGSRGAGLYSVGLTASWAVGAVAWAISFASFPQISSASPSEASALGLRTTRVAGAAGIVCGVVLAAATPALLPLVFGARYTDAIGPCLVLIPGAILTSEVVVLGRAVAAKGNARPYLLASAATLVVMTLADLAVIPLAGIVGAAAVSSVSSAVGFYVIATLAVRVGFAPARRACLPRFADFVFLFTAGGRISFRRGWYDGTRSV